MWSLQIISNQRWNPKRRQRPVLHSIIRVVSDICFGPLLKKSVRPNLKVDFSEKKLFKTAQIYSTCFSKGFAPLSITSCGFVQLKKYILVKVSVGLSIDHPLLSAIAVEILTRLKIAKNWTNIKFIVDSRQRTGHVKWQQLSQMKVIAEHLRKTLETKKNKRWKKTVHWFLMNPNHSIYIHILNNTNQF